MKFMLLVLASLVLAACGKGKSSSSSTPHLEVQNNALIDALHLHTLNENVPSGMGALMSLDNGKVDTCTWFLVGSDLAMTSNLCVPKFFQHYTDKKCGDYLKGKIKTDKGEAAATCRDIITYSTTFNQTTQKEYGFVLMQLNEKIEDAHYFNISREGAVDTEIVSIQNLDHNDVFGKVTTSFSKNECMILTSPYYGPILNPAVSPFIAYQTIGTRGNCENKGKHKGSPVLNQWGSVIGMTYGTPDEMNTRWIKTDLKVEQPSQAVLIENFRCADFRHPDLDQTLPDTCSNELRVYRKVREFGVKQVEEKILEVFKRSQPEFLKYNITPSAIEENRFSLTAEPVCINPLDKWSSFDLTFIDDYTTVKRVKKTSFTTKFSGWFTAKIDTRGEVSVTINETAKKSRFIFKDLDQLKEKGSVPMSVDGSFSPDKAIYDKEMILCGE